MLKIYTIAPVIASPHISEASYQAFLDQQFADLAGVQVIGRLLDSGPSSVENEMDDALAVPGILQAGLKARQEGADGILIDCMLDPGLKALRTALDIPVMGAAEIGFRVAATLGNKFGIVDVCDDTGPMVEAQVRAMGLGDRFAGVRGTGLAVEEVEKNETLTMARLLDAASRAVREDGADILVFGCTEFSRYTDKLRKCLLNEKIDVPVINPTALAVGVLAAVARSGIAHSKRAYPSPSEKKSLRGYDLPQLYDVLKD